MKLAIINLVLLANILVPSPKNKLSVDLEDRRNETKLHKLVTIQWDNFRAEWQMYIVEGQK